MPPDHPQRRFELANLAHASTFTAHTAQTSAQAEDKAAAKPHVVTCACLTQGVTRGRIKIIPPQLRWGVLRCSIFDCCMAERHQRQLGLAVKPCGVASARSCWSPGSAGLPCSPAPDLFKAKIIKKTQRFGARALLVEIGPSPSHRCLQPQAPAYSHLSSNTCPKPQIALFFPQIFCFSPIPSDTEERLLCCSAQ